ncbi:hypothetical protein DSO57_1010998 [Entomophthora muscae]|uniref:Uncharacterized protein n=1 Tax=Entomophthora muscae TaxID=34485 RepID=A0ACC2RL42_9FUNG|nr:hypothetical protein DSO57_1010998 [Entomophthora muscae]
MNPLATIFILGVHSSLQICPAISDYCFSYLTTYAPNHPFTLPCWKREESWKCMGYLNNEKGNCEQGYTNVFSCIYPINEAKCPEKSHSCISGDIVYGATNSDAPKCWFKRHSDNWQCDAIETCDASLGLVNLTKCF